MNRVLVAAGTSVNKMNSVAATIKKKCDDKQVQVEVYAENVYEVNLSEINPAVIVLLGVNQFDTELPIIDGVPFMTTIGIDDAIDKIIENL